MRSMSLESAAAFRDAAELPDWEPDERERLTHCPKCGAFLPSKPTFEGGIIAVDRDYGYDSPDGRWIPCIETVEEVYEPNTDCGKCGTIYTEMDLWQ